MIETQLFNMLDTYEATFQKLERFVCKAKNFEEAKPLFKECDAQADSMIRFINSSPVCDDVRDALKETALAICESFALRARLRAMFSEHGCVNETDD